MTQRNRPRQPRTRRAGDAIPLDRRGFLKLTGTAGALGAVGGPLLAACSTNSGGPAITKKGGVTINEYVPGPQPVSGGHYGGTVRVSWANPPDSFDPALGENLTAWDALTELVYFGALMAYDKTFGGPVPNLAAAAPAISSDGKTLTFKIRQDAKFHNGRKIVSGDFKYAWERMLDPKLQSWGASYLSSVVGASQVMAGKTKQLEGVETPADSTLVMHLTAPDFTILNALTQPITAPVPSEDVERLGKQFGQTPVGYGPFKIVSYNQAGQTARFERNPHYMYPGLPYLDAVEYHWGVDQQIQLQQLEHGDTDIVGDGLPPTEAGQVLASPTLRPLAKSRPSPGNVWLTMYPETVPAFRSREVRQAMNWAINKNTLARVMYGTSTPWGAPFPKGLADFHATFLPYGFDPQKAKDLLAQGGFKKGFSVTMSVSADPPFPAIAQVVQQQYAAIGVHVTINQIDSNALISLEYAQQAGRKKLQMSTDSWYMVQPTPADEVNAIYTTKASSNYCAYSNPDVDALAKRALAEFSETSRNKLYAQIQQLIGDDAPFVFLASTDWLAGISQKIQNYQYRGETYSYYDRMWV